MKNFLKILFSLILGAGLTLFPAPAQAACTTGVGSSPDANGNGLVCVGGSFMAQVFGGPVAIGTSTPLLAYTLTVNGSAYLSTGTLWTLSDIRAKKDVEDIAPDALETVNKLRPVTYLWKNPRDAAMKKRQIGFIAQEVQKVLPDLVVVPEDEKQMLSLQYNGFIPVLTKAVQELSQHQATLEKRLAALEARNRELSEKLEAYANSAH